MSFNIIFSYICSDLGPYVIKNDNFVISYKLYLLFLYFCNFVKNYILSNEHYFQHCIQPREKTLMK